MDLEEFADTKKKEELKYYDAAIERIDKEFPPLFFKAYDHSLKSNELQLLQRQLQQASVAYETASKNEKFEFIIYPHLETQLAEKRKGAASDLKNALLIVETKLLHQQPSKKNRLL